MILKDAPLVTMDCPSCGAPKISFTVKVLQEPGVTRLHGVIACSNCDQPKQVVVEWPASPPPAV